MALFCCSILGRLLPIIDTEAKSLMVRECNDKLNSFKMVKVKNIKKFINGSSRLVQNFSWLRKHFSSQCPVMVYDMNKNDRLIPIFVTNVKCVDCSRFCVPVRIKAPFLKRCRNQITKTCYRLIFKDITVGYRLLNLG